MQQNAGSKRTKEEEPAGDSNVSERGSPLPEGSELNGIGGEEQNGLGEDSPSKKASLDVELDSKTLTFAGGNKRIHIDVKENDRGRFIKITELAQAKNRMTFSMCIAKEIAGLLQEFVNAFQEHETKADDDEKPATEQQSEDEGEAKGKKKQQRGRKQIQTLHTKTIIDNARRYFIDLLPSSSNNGKTYFLRIVQSLSPGVRSSIAVPAEQGIEQLKQALEDAVEKFWVEDQPETAPIMPEGRSLRLGGKSFFFDPGSNGRGEFIRLTESSGPRGRARRSMITIPFDAVAECSQILAELHDKMTKLLETEDGQPRDEQTKRAPKKEAVGVKDESAEVAEDPVAAQ